MAVNSKQLHLSACEVKHYRLSSDVDLNIGELTVAEKDTVTPSNSISAP